MNTPALGDRFKDALSYAATVHAGQVRKATAAPYISHLLAVCALVLEHGGTEDEAIAALLHDTLEDHPETVSREGLCQRFGEAVAAIVQGCSDTPSDWRGGQKPPWRQRKVRYLECLRREGASVVLVALADKLHNVRAILELHREIGDQVWVRFNAGLDDQLWYFRELVRAFRGSGAPPAMLRAFERAVDELEREAGTSASAR